MISIATKHRRLNLALTFWLMTLCRHPIMASDNILFEDHIQPILSQFCTPCHNEEDRSGELDLSHWTTQQMIHREVGRLEQIEWQISNGEMPPKNATKLPSEKRELLLNWITQTEQEIAETQAGDPGPVTMRRLSNHEYTYAIQDLTGIPSLDPAKEFPVDGAAGEGFSNVGSALVMSPGLLTKYLDSAKDIASHAVLLPDRIEFSASNSPADWSQEKLEAIRRIYTRYGSAGESSEQNLQGVKFSTVDATIIPLRGYLLKLVESSDEVSPGERSELGAIQPPNPASTRLSPKYLEKLREVGNVPHPSILIEEFQSRMRETTPANIDEMISWIRSWQNGLWYFGKVGHIGKRDGPEAWQNAVLPIATEQRLEESLNPEDPTLPSVTLHLVAHDAGDGNEGDQVLWRNAKITALGSVDIPLKHSKEIFARARQLSVHHLEQTPMYLRLFENQLDVSPKVIAAKAKALGLSDRVALAWQKIITSIQQPHHPKGHLVGKVSNVSGYADIRGWGQELPTLLTNRSNDEIRFSTLRVPARAVTVHPTPTIDSVIDWRSPLNGPVSVKALFADMDSVCGNGVAFSLEWIHNLGTTTLAVGQINNGQRESIEVPNPIQIKPSDLIRLTVKPSDNNHTCDTTQVALTIQKIDDPTQRWDLATDIVDRIHEANPLPDRFGNPAVWHFCQSTEDKQSLSTLHPNSTLARTLRTIKTPRTTLDQSQIKKTPAEVITQSLLKPTSSSDEETARTLQQLSGPFPWLAMAMDEREDLEENTTITQAAPSVLKFDIPAELASQALFTASASIDTNENLEGSVQLQATTTPTEARSRLQPGDLIPGSVAQETAWTDGQTPMVSNLPVLVQASSRAYERIHSAIRDFQEIFPAALSYHRIVPVDEVVTLTLLYREDEQLAQLMLSKEEQSELERLWRDLLFIGRHAIKQQDAFEQLWQYATQDADPSAFEPMRDPIERAVRQFHESLKRIEPEQVKAAIALASRVWRRPISDNESKDLFVLYNQFSHQGLSHEQAIRQLIARIFVAPEFLYRIETTKDQRSANQNPQQQRVTPQLSMPSIERLSDWELASRLSFFLWSSCPDEKLIKIAKNGDLSRPSEIEMQVRRMVADPKIRRLATEFGSQWFGVRDLSLSEEKSERHFPTFTQVRGDMHEEVIRFWMHLIQNNCSPMDLILSDTTFMNGRLAKHYGIDESIVPWSSSGWHRVEGLVNHGRGGVLGLAAILAQNSGASRTSPILRGNWVSETLLGERLPDPPNDVATLPDVPPEGTTERELIELHSRNPNCARCHQRIDPYGFALENFDSIGRHRPQRDTRSKLPDGTEINGLSGLQRYLGTQRAGDFLRQFSRKLLGYALGRSVQLSDRPLIDEMVSSLRAPNSQGIEDAILRIVHSTQFTHRRASTPKASKLSEDLEP